MTPWTLRQRTASPRALLLAAAALVGSACSGARPPAPAATQAPADAPVLPSAPAAQAPAAQAPAAAAGAGSALVYAAASPASPEELLLPLLGPSALSSLPPGTAGVSQVEEAVLEEGGRLRLRVVHGGGCKTHGYGVSWDGAFLESAPPQVRLRLHHDDGGDRCRALVRRVLRVDLAPLQEAYRAGYRTAHGTLVLTLEERPERVQWTF